MCNVCVGVDCVYRLIKKIVNDEKTLLTIPNKKPSHRMHYSLNILPNLNPLYSICFLQSTHCWRIIQYILGISYVRDQRSVCRSTFFVLHKQSLTHTVQLLSEMSKSCEKWIGRTGGLNSSFQVQSITASLRAHPFSRSLSNSYSQ